MRGSRPYSKARLLFPSKMLSALSAMLCTELWEEKPSCLI